MGALHRPSRVRPRAVRTGRVHRADAGTTEKLVEVKIQVQVPPGFSWVEFAARHPELVLVTLNRHTAGAHHIVAEVLVQGGEDRDWTEEMGATPSVVSAQRLAHVGRPRVYRVEWRAPLFYTRMLDRYDLVGAVPFTISGRAATVSIAVRRPTLRSLMAELRRRQFEPKILQLRTLRAAPAPGGLTPTQRMRFQSALEAGYFDVPRRASLDQLARRFSVRKSAFAESLALARQKILVAAGHLLESGDEAARAALLGT